MARTQPPFGEDVFVGAANLTLRPRKVRGVIVYPPDAYFFIPYLAPWLLSGYIASRGHELSVRDLNIEFHKDAWFGDLGSRRPELFRARGDRPSALLAEMVDCLGKDSWDRLRIPETYSDIDEVHRSASVLNVAQELGEKLRGSDSWARGESPTDFGQWQWRVDGALAGEYAHFFRRLVGSGDFDRHEIVGISATYMSQVLPTLLLARLIKQRDPAATIVVGGGAVTHLVDHLANDPSFFGDVDVVVPFEGEWSFAEIFDLVATRNPIEGANLMTVRDGEVVYEKDLTVRPRVEAKPDFDNLVHDYPTPHPIIPLLTSKGCYWGKCTFCTHFEGYGEGYFAFGKDFTGEQVSELVEKGVHHFYFVDEALPPKRLSQFVDLFEEAMAQGRDISWMAEARVDKALVSEEAVERLARSGCKLLVNGIETGSKRVTELMRKGIDLDLVERHAALCRKQGIRTGWMFFVGFPGETPNEAQETFEFIRRNRDSLAFASVGSFVLERGAPVYLAPGEFGIDEILNADRAYAVAFDYVMNGELHTTALARRELISLHENNPDVNDIFTSAVDRALMMFVPPEVDVRDAGGRILNGEISISWYSTSEDASVTLILPRQQLIVERTASEVNR